MELARYVDRVQHDLVAAAEVGGDEAGALAERLAGTLASSLSLALLDALSEAASELTDALAPGSVDLTLREGAPRFSVTPPPVVDRSESGHDKEDESAEPAESAAASLEGPTLRINLRLPENLKHRVEEAARQEGLSINTWLVRAAAAVLERDGAGGRPRTRRRTESGEDHVTGWMR